MLINCNYFETFINLIANQFVIYQFFSKDFYKPTKIIDCAYLKHFSLL
jgi:hypothetical protein